MRDLSHSLFKNVYLFIWLPWVFIATSGLSLAEASRGYSLAAAHQLLVVVASLVAEHKL